eukprot:TRINITY_DN21727_c1_g4_i1.p1 TRINITY_DN21727_c1_g4~~TRINITY_DN21727_c1_g4_i1.p1  ORF type:complete len:852 (-),score=197.37 TRINITY_DN21727_c1_g4_i1:98-2653(-)
MASRASVSNGRKSVRGSRIGSISASQCYASCSIKVCIRVRPFAKREVGKKCCISMPNKSHVVVTDENGHSKEFEYDRAYWSHNPGDAHFASQETLMQEVGIEMLNNAHEGFNCCLFAYGQTGSGKTHSVLGGETAEMRGLLPRVLEALFTDVRQETTKTVRFICKVSYCEIYHEQIQDLLMPPDSRQEQGKLEVRSHPKFGHYVPGLTESVVESYEEVQKMLEFGMAARSVAATNMNAGSSRSHCIFAFELERITTPADGGAESHLRSKVNLVDLAGSERQSKTGAEGKTLKEGAMINQSLTNLALVIAKLADNSKDNGNQDFVPFRNSKITHILQDSLSGNSKTVLIAAISPAESEYEETISTLRFASTCKKIALKPVKNEESKESIIANLKAEIARMNAEGRECCDVQHLESLRKNLEKDYSQQIQEAKMLHQMRDNAMKDFGLSLEDISSMMNVDKDTPKLINISDDPSLSGSLVYYLTAGDQFGVGTDPSNKIKMNGLGMKPFLCKLDNDANTTVTMTRVNADGSDFREGPDNGRVLVNGRPVGRTTVLMHTDRIIFGHAFCFRLVIPAAPAAGRQADEDIEQALHEVIDVTSDEFSHARAMMEAFEDRIGATQSRAFLEEFSRALPLLQEGNLITNEMRADDRLRFQLEVCSDIQRFTTDQPELIVRLFKSDAAGNEDVLDVFEFPQYKERLEMMREAYAEFAKDKRKRARAFAAGTDPWKTYTYKEVQQLLEKERRRHEEQAFKLQRTIEKLQMQLGSSNGRKKAYKNGIIPGSTAMRSPGGASDSPRSISSPSSPQDKNKEYTVPKPKSPTDGRLSSSVPVARNRCVTPKRIWGVMGAGSGPWK